MSEPCSDQHQDRVAVGKGADYPGPSSNLELQPFQRVVGAQTAPVLWWQVVVTQRLADTRESIVTVKPERPGASVAPERPHPSVNYSCRISKSAWMRRLNNRRIHIRSPNLYATAPEALSDRSL